MRGERTPGGGETNVKCARTPATGSLRAFESDRVRQSDTEREAREEMRERKSWRKHTKYHKRVGLQPQDIQDIY